MVIRTISTAIVIASLSTAAAAQQSDRFDACAQEKDAAARLACFDREIANRREAQPATAPAATTPAAPATPTTATSAAPAAAPSAPTPATTAQTTSARATATPAPAPAANADVGLDARQASRERRERGEAEASRPAAIVAKVVRVIPRQPLISAFELDNGQIWEQSESMHLTVRPQDEVTIRPGVLGAFFLKSADGAVVRAHRVR